MRSLQSLEFLHLISTLQEILLVIRFAEPLVNVEAIAVRKTQAVPISEAVIAVSAVNPLQHTCESFFSLLSSFFLQRFS